MHLAWKTTQPIPYCNSGFWFASRILIFESIIKQKDNTLIVWDRPTLFLCFCVESHSQKQLGKSLFQLTAYRQSLSKIRVGLQDKRPKQWRNTALLDCPNWFVQLPLFFFLLCFETTSSGLALPTIVWVLPYQPVRRQWLKFCWAEACLQADLIESFSQMWFSLTKYTYNFAILEKLSLKGIGRQMSNESLCCTSLWARVQILKPIHEDVSWVWCPMIF